VNLRRRLLIAAAWTLAGSFGASFAFGGATWQTPWRALLVQTLVNSMFSGCCVTLCIVGLPWVVPRARRLFAFPWDSLAILVTLVLFGVAGSLVGTGLGVLIGVVPPSAFLKTWYPFTLQISVYLTVIFGASGAALEEVRARLERTTLTLRTKERDEAEARRLAAEAQLASLESRVDPHFLFNTLNSIAALVRENPTAAERVIEQLAALMRSSLDRRASLVPLAEELALVQSYLEIERVRFGERLRFCIDAGDGVQRALVPRLSLQTLAENAVKYAVAPSREGAFVKVSGLSNDGQLRLTVEDDGPGFDGTQLPEGHGLRLLKSRIAMTFGDRAQLTTDGRAGRTRITLTLPFIETPPSAQEPAPAGATRDLTCL
jgi:two-component system, LytTR family, sensor histidine kinase AlgZ